MAIRPDEMLAEPCTLLTAPGREQIQQMAMQGLGVTDVGKLSDMPMCYLSGIPAEILVRFNERVVFLDQHTGASRIGLGWRGHRRVKKKKRACARARQQPSRCLG